MRVLEAGATELERELGFGVVRALFEGVLVHASAARRRSLLSGAAGLAAPGLSPGSAGGGGPAEPAAVPHGLFWVFSNLPERGRPVLVRGDAHRAGRPALRVFADLAR